MLDLELMEAVAATTKRNEKLELLRRMRDKFPGSGRIVKLAVDPAVVFYVTADEGLELTAFAGNSDDSGPATVIWWTQLELLCGRLSRREVTGNAALAEVRHCSLSAPSANHVRWMCRVLNKDLCAGVNVATANDVWPGLVSKFEVMLAEAYDPDKHALDGSWIADPKMDGNRVVLVRGVAYSRNGRVYSSFPHITEKHADLSQRFLVDGEMMASGKFDANSGKLRRKSERADDAHFNVFDLVPIAEWDAKDFVTPLHERKSMLLSELDQSDAVSSVDWWDLSEQDKTTDRLYVLRDKVMALGFEGIMLKNLDAPYRPGRSSDLLKLKRFDTYDGRIVAVLEHRKQKGMMGALEVELEDGTRCKCGSGFTKLQRKERWEDSIGCMVEMEAQERTPDGSLRFPTFVRLRPDKD